MGAHPIPLASHPGLEPDRGHGRLPRHQRTQGTIEDDRDLLFVAHRALGRRVQNPQPSPRRRPTTWRARLEGPRRFPVNGGPFGLRNAGRAETETQERAAEQQQGARGRDDRHTSSLHPLGPGTNALLGAVRTDRALPTSRRCTRVAQ